MIGIPAGMQPRAAVVYMTMGALECAALCGAAPALHAEVDTAVALLEQLIEEWGPGGAEDSLPKRVARELHETIPVVHGAVSTVAVGRRWSTLGDPDQHPRVKQRIELMAAEVERTGAPAIQVDARGESRLERVLSLVLLGDIVSVYMAALAGVDPTPVEAIERFKQRL